MNRTILVVFILLGYIITSCNLNLNISETNFQQDINGNYIFTASWNQDDITKTIRQDDGSVLWDAHESIKIFYNSETYGVFTSLNDSAVSTTSFSGQFNNTISDIDISQNGVMALYPSQEAEYDGNSIIFTISNEQEAIAGSFKNGLFPSIAQSNNSSLSFYNICGGIKLSVYYEGIKAITLRGNNSEYLAGRISVSLNNTGVPDYSVIDGISEITLTAPKGEYFEVGTAYYIVALPCTLLNGFTITYHTDNENASVSINRTISIHRSKFGLVMNKDIQGFVVKFDDDALKSCVLEQYDDNFDGEIDYIEAQNVTNINCANKKISSLNGIEHFTNLKTLNCSGNLLESINLNSMGHLTTLICYDNPIRELILDKCQSLITLLISDATTNSICDKKVVIDGHNELDQFVFSSLETGFTDFTYINSEVTSLEVYGDFSKSINIYNNPNITKFDVGHLNVDILDLHNLNLSTIDLTNNTNLKELYLQDNSLTAINLSKNAMLEKLNIENNNLSSLNLRSCTELSELIVSNNPSISVLNLDNNLSLEKLYAEGLSIIELDMSKQSKLTDAHLRNNTQLHSIIIWDKATKKNDFLHFDMKNIIVNDKEGNSYGYPYYLGQYIPWFNGAIIFDINEEGGGLMVATKKLSGELYYNPTGAEETRMPEAFWNNSQSDGLSNQKAVLDYYGNYDKFVAYESCASYSADGNYYLPSLDELICLLENRQYVNNTMYNMSSSNGYTWISVGLDYLSSTTIGGALVYYVDFYSNANIIKHFYTDSAVSYTILPIRRF